MVALPPGATEPQILSGQARDIWDELADPASPAQLTGSTGGDVAATLDALLAAGLVTTIDPGLPARPPASVLVAGSGGRRPTAGGAVDPLVGALTFWLPGGPDPICAEALSGVAWDRVMARARRERCFGPLCWAVGTGALPTTQEQREEAERHAILGARHALEQEQQLLDVTQALCGNGIDVRVLKGLAVAHLDHLEPSFRASADLDLLVRSNDLAAAVDLLTASGYTRELPERRAGYDERYEKDVTLQAPDLYEVDLHRLPLAGPLGLGLDLDLLWSRHEPFTVGGTELRALVAEARFAHAAWSLALTDPMPRLVPALDMVAIAHAHNLEPGRLEEIAPSGAGRLALDLAIRLAVTLLGPPAGALLPAPATPPPSRRDRALIRTYPGQGGSKAAYLLAGASALPSWRDRLRYLEALLAPSTRYRAARRQGVRRPEWRIAMSALRPRRRPKN